MIKATGIGPREGKKTLFVGLSQGNLNKFMAAPMDNYILIKGEDVGLSHDVLIFHGKTEGDMLELLAHGMGPGTKVMINERSKN